MDLLSPSLPLIRALQLSPWLKAPMLVLSALGSEQFFLLLLPLIYWNINRGLGARLGVLLLFSVAFNDLLKVVFALPRPFWSPGIAQLAPSPEKTFGFPSGHAQNTAALWGYLALQSHRRIWLAAALLLLLLIAVSRLYLGAHYPLDVAGGALLGCGILWVFTRLETPAGAWWNDRNLAAQIGLSLGLCAILGALFWMAKSRLVEPQTVSAGYETWRIAVAGAGFGGRVGALFGLLIGLALARRGARFDVVAGLGTKSLRFALGVVVLAGLRFGVGKLLPVAVATSFGLYFGLTFWVTFGAPWLFLRLGWMRRVEPSSASV